MRAAVGTEGTLSIHLNEHTLTLLQATPAHKGLIPQPFLYETVHANHSGCQRQA